MSSARYVCPCGKMTTGSDVVPVGDSEVCPRCNQRTLRRVE